MKKAFFPTIFLTSLISFTIGLFWDDIYVREETLNVVIDDYRIDWNISRNLDDQDVEIDLYVRNLSKTEVADNIYLEVTVDPSKLSHSFIKELVELLGVDSLNKSWDENPNDRSPKLIAIKKYVDRGYTSLNKKTYEDIENYEDWEYTTRVPLNINLSPLESARSKVTILIPWIRKGHTMSLKIVNQ